MVHICEIMFIYYQKNELSESDINYVGKSSKYFCKYFISTYYQTNNDRIHFCKHVFHLLLNLEDSTRDFGSLSVLEQFLTEIFIDVINRRYHATFKF